MGNFIIGSQNYYRVVPLLAYFTYPFKHGVASGKRVEEVISFQSPQIEMSVTGASIF